MHLVLHACSHAADKVIDEIMAYLLEALHFISIFEVRIVFECNLHEVIFFEIPLLLYVVMDIAPRA